MFFHLIAMAQIAESFQKLENERWKNLTAEQRAEELRIREVRALERLAAAAENPRREVHHHFF